MSCLRLSVGAARGGGGGSRDERWVDRHVRDESRVEGAPLREETSARRVPTRGLFRSDLRSSSSAETPTAEPTPHGIASDILLRPPEADVAKLLPRSSDSDCSPLGSHDRAAQRRQSAARRASRTHSHPTHGSVGDAGTTLLPAAAIFDRDGRGGCAARRRLRTAHVGEQRTKGPCFGVKLYHLSSPLIQPHLGPSFGHRKGWRYRTERGREETHGVPRAAVVSS